MPVSEVGRTLALVFMFSGILLITTIMSVVSTSFYKRKMCKVEDERRQQEFEHLKTVLLNRLSDIDEKRSKFEEKQTKFNDLIEDLRSMIHNNNK